MGRNDFHRLSSEVLFRLVLQKITPTAIVQGSTGSSYLKYLFIALRVSILCLDGAQLSVSCEKLAPRKSNKFFGPKRKPSICALVSTCTWQKDLHFLQ